MKPLLLSICIILSVFALKAQNTQPVTPATDTARVVIIRNADKYGTRKVDSLTELRTAVGHVCFQDGNTLLYADSTVQNTKLNIIEAFGNVRIDDNDSIHTRSQYLIYYIDKKLAVLKRNVSLTDGKGVLTTNELTYNTALKTGTYVNGGKVVNGKTVLTSKEATYYADLKDVYFKQNVKMRDPAYNLDTDSLLYNTESKLATFITKTNIRDSSGSRIVTSEGFYNLETKMARFGKRATIVDKALTVTGDNIAIDDKTGQFQAVGNAVMIDTSQGLSVLANDIKANRTNNTFIATQHPLMIIKQDNDSLYVSADTLFAGRLTDLPGYTRKGGKDSIRSTKVVKTSDTANQNRYFQAYRHVKIFSDSLQAMSDSLFYSGRDSIFQLFHNPIVWASHNQITGDTIYLYTKNKQAERMYVFENGMLINQSDEDMFNQIKANTLNGFFKNGEVDHMTAKGSAESVYYARDEANAVVGMNSATADVIDMFFAKKELHQVVYRNDVAGTMYPFRQIPEDKKRLRNFKWQEELRPKTKYELFGN